MLSSVGSSRFESIGDLESISLRVWGAGGRGEGGRTSRRRDARALSFLDRERMLFFSFSFAHNPL